MSETEDEQWELYCACASACERCSNGHKPQHRVQEGDKVVWMHGNDIIYMPECDHKHCGAEPCAASALWEEYCQKNPESPLTLQLLIC